MRELKPRLNNRFFSFNDWKISIGLGAAPFCISQLLHFGYVYLQHRFIKVNRRFPFRLRVGERRIKIKPASPVSTEDYRYIQQRPEHIILKCAIVLPIHESGIIRFEPPEHIYAQPLLSAAPEAPARSFYPTFPPALPERTEVYSNRGECTTRMI